MKRTIIELLIKLGLILIENLLVPLLNGLMKGEDKDDE